MAVSLGVVGAVLIALVVLDMLKTTVVVAGGGGPLTQRVARWLWDGALRRHAKRPSRRGLVRGSYAILFAMVVLWVLTLWLGWTLVFMAGDRAVLDADTLSPASAWSRAYFAGFSLITLGVGDYVPGGAPWQVLTVLAAANGFFVVTLTITYLAPVLSAIVEKRSLAASIVDLGSTPTDMIRSAWNDGGLDGLDGLDAAFTSLASRIRTHEQRHLAYPLLFFSVSEHRRTSDAVALAILDETITLIEVALPREHRPASQAWRSVRNALDGILGMRQAVAAQGELHAPAPPTSTLVELRAAGLPVVADDDVARGMAGVAERRSRLALLVRDAGWSWDTVYAATEHEDDHAPS